MVGRNLENYVNGNDGDPKANVCFSLASDDAAFGYPRNFFDNQFVYTVISPRAGGLSIGVNLNPIVRCTLNCVYCEIDRTLTPRATQLNVDQMGDELLRTMKLALAGGLRERAPYSSLPSHLLELRHVTLSGDGEPTLAKNFVEAVEAVVHLRASAQMPYFKIVLLTNSTQLDQPEVWRGLKMLTRADEVWAKLDGGTQDYLTKVNGQGISIEKVTANIQILAQKRPVVIQSLFPEINGEGPSEFEIQKYASRLRRLKESGAEIPLVQVYSATRPMPRGGCSHLPLKALSRIAHKVRKVAGLRAEVY